VVRHLEAVFGISERRGCGLLGQARSTQRQRTKPAEEERKLVQRILELVGRHPRFGYRRIWALLRREGWRVNRKRIWRLWRQQGLKVPRKQRKKRRLGSSANSCVRHRPEYRNHVWSWDFIFDRTQDGRPLKWFTLVDEYTRECLALEVNRRMTAQAVTRILARVISERGAPVHIRSDNGSEFIAKSIRSWMAGASIGTLYIEPGAPWENGYGESFNSKLRDELLDGEEFTSLLEAKVLARQWRQEYNHERPHSALAYQTPAEFGQMCAGACSATLRRPQHTSTPVDTTLIASGT
jgi:putative transposase